MKLKEAGVVTMILLGALVALAFISPSVLEYEREFGVESDAESGPYAEVVRTLERGRLRRALVASGWRVDPNSKLGGQRFIHFTVQPDSHTSLEEVIRLVATAANFDESQLIEIEVKHPDIKDLDDGGCYVTVSVEPGTTIEETIDRIPLLNEKLEDAMPDSVPCTWPDGFFSF